MKITGEKIVEINGERYTLRFTWRALSEIEEKFGQNPNMFDPEVVAAMAEAGFKEKHPDLTAEKILELSPPLIPFAKAVQDAFKYAYFGNEPMPDEVKKKTKTGLLAKHIKWLFRRGSHQ